MTTLGFGNPIVTGDDVGIQVVWVAAAGRTGIGIDFQEGSVGGLRVLDQIEP